MAKEPTAISIKPSDFVAGGGLPNDVDVEITKARVEMFTYPGGDTSALSVRLEFTNIETGEEFIQNLSAGKDFVPNEAGTGFVPTGSKTALTEGSNFFIFMASAVNEGFDESKIENDVTVFEGLQCHVERKEQKEVQVGKKRESLVVTAIIALPWEPKKKKKIAGGAGGAKPAASKSGVATSKASASAPKAKAAAAASSSASTDDDLDARAVSVLQDIVASKEGAPVARTALRGAAFKLLMKEPAVRNGVLALFDDEEKLTGICSAAGFDFDGETVSIPE